jgi:hypothetical protein
MRSSYPALTLGRRRLWNAQAAITSVTFNDHPRYHLSNAVALACGGDDIHVEPSLS